MSDLFPTSTHEVIVEGMVDNILHPQTFGWVEDAPERALFAVESCLSISIGECYCSNCEAGAQCMNDLVGLTAYAACKAPLIESPLYGHAHWMSVYRNAVMIAEAADLHQFKVPGDGEEMPPTLDLTAVIILFSLFHDCRRHGVGPCNLHGGFGSAALMSALYRDGVAPILTDEALVAAMAINCHTVLDYPLTEPSMLGWDEDVSPTLDADIVRAAVGLCLDADRVDLGRMEIVPDTKYLTHPDASMRVYNKLSQLNVWGH